jgi:hypothetical protein
MSDKVAAFEKVRRIGLSLPDVEATTKYDGSPVLKLGGCFMAGLANHRSAEPDTLVVGRETHTFLELDFVGLRLSRRYLSLTP